MKEARQPQFQMIVNDQTFELVLAHLQALNYHGPLGLSCDDTKLFAAWRMYWDGNKKVHFVVGGVGGPFQVADAEKLTELLAEAKIVKATKVHARQFN